MRTLLPLPKVMLLPERSRLSRFLSAGSGDLRQQQIDVVVRQQQRVTVVGMGVSLLPADQHIVDIARLCVKVFGHAAAGLLLQR